MTQRERIAALFTRAAEDMILELTYTPSRAELTPRRVQLLAVQAEAVRRIVARVPEREIELLGRMTDDEILRAWRELVAPELRKDCAALRPN